MGKINADVDGDALTMTPGEDDKWGVNLEASDSLWRLVTLLGRVSLGLKWRPLTIEIANAIASKISNVSLRIADAQDVNELNYWRRSKDPEKVALHRERFIQSAKAGAMGTEVVKELAGYYDRLDELAEEISRIAATARLVAQ